MDHMNHFDGWGRGFYHKGTQRINNEVVAVIKKLHPYEFDVTV